VTGPCSQVVALDFDGVLCDSAPETGLTAWRAGRQVWPDWRTPRPPAPVLERFIALRPLLETGYQSVPLMRLAWEGVGAADLAGGFEGRVDAVIAAAGMTRGAMVELFGATRDAWIAEDLPGWLAAHRFYPGVVEALRRAEGTSAVRILSTKQERFIRQLLAGAEVRIPQACIYGLEAGKSKRAILRDVLREAGGGGGACFVEDRLDTLLPLADDPALADVRLCLAAWGYNTAAERQRARDGGRIALLELADFAGIFDGIGGPQAGTGGAGPRAGRQRPRPQT